MTGKQLTLTGITLAIAALLFYLGFKTPFAQADTQKQGTAGLPFDYEAYKLQAETKLSPDLRQELKSLRDRGPSDHKALAELARLWDSTGNKLISAQYSAELAEAEPDAGNWYMAGSRYYDAVRAEEDSATEAYAAGGAQKAFEKVLVLDPKNLAAKNALAVIYVEVNQDVMKGVSLLKEVVTEDSNNVQAILTLGMLSVRSGQMDKARQRFEKLVSLQPFNPEFYYYLGEAYAKSGETEKAVRTYETCQTLVKDEKAKKEIQNIINQLKTL